MPVKASSKAPVLRRDGRAVQNCTGLYDVLTRLAVDWRRSQFFSRMKNKSVLRRPIHDWRKLIRQSLVLLICVGFTSYFAYHAKHGRHGLEANRKFLERLTLLEFEIKSLEAARARLSQDIALLSPELPNADLVEEIARDVLGYVHPDDKVILVEAQPRINTTRSNAYHTR